MVFFNKETGLIIYMVKFSVRHCWFNMYGRLPWCQHFVTVSKFSITGKSSGERIFVSY